MPAAKSEPFSNVDAAWLHMEDPTNLMMITGVLMFETPVDPTRLASVIESRLLTFDRFRMRIVNASQAGAARWEPDPYFHMRAHLHRIALPSPGGQAALQELVSDLMSTPIDLTKSPWQMHLVENFNGGSALLVRLHHAIADGIALVRILLSLTDDAPDAPDPPDAPVVGRGPSGPLAGVLRPLNAAVRTGALVVNEGLETLAEPERVLEAARMGASGVAALNKLLFMPPDPPTLLKGPLGTEKRAAWSQPIPLDDVKAVGQLTRGTVNDVLINAATGALRRYLIRHGAPVDGVDIRAVVPVNLRPLDKPITKLGNQFGVIFLSLPVGIEDPFDRLLELRRRMDAIKGSPEAVVAFGILHLIGVSPPQLADMAIDLFGSKATAVMTNVPGPRQPIYLAGSKIDSVMFWVPQSGKLGLGVSIFSYAGSVLLGVATDAGLIPDPDAIVADFHAEMDELIRLAHAVAAPREATTQGV